MEDLYNMEMDEYSDSPNAVNYECTEAVLDLATFYGKGTPVFSAWRSAILRKHRGKGHGTYLYEEMLDYLKRTEGRHVILIPEDCLAGGGTSDDAWRVWASLSRRYVHGAFGVSSERLSD
jgi:GNAT superfamily N-acetyltransferase